ncbi:MAG: RDD family protein [Candidatus Schekmanbacteria bacterium]|nr:RDD family protein [Candidatus Schekmanbacteria bacterium]
MTVSADSSVPREKVFPWEREGDRITFETPEQTLVEYEIAPFSSRIAAAFFDRLIVSAVVLVIWIGLLLPSVALEVDLGAAGDALGTTSYLIAAALVLQFLSTTFYFVWAEVRGCGQTIGKRLIGIRTVLATGQGITIGPALLRNLARVVDELPLLWLIPALTRGKRRIGDYLAGTYVVVAAREGSGRKTAAAEALGAPSYGALGMRRFYFSAETAAKLYPDDLNLLEHVHERLGHAPESQTHAVLGEVAERYIERLALLADADRIRAAPDRFLLELELFLRDRFEGQAY